jgi:anti-sigma B factor antagonist
MEITTTEHKGCVHVKVKGRIDTHTVGEFRDKFNEILEAGKSRIILDMSDVEHIAGYGLWVLQQIQKACNREGGKLVIVNIPEDMKRSLLELAGLNYLFEVYDDIDEAGKSF